MNLNHPPEHNIHNLLLAIVLSTAILFGWQILVEEPPVSQEKQMKETGDVRLPQAPRVASVQTAIAPPQEVAEPTPRLRIVSDILHGSIALRGGRIDQLTLARYRETVDEHSDEVTLLADAQGRVPYFAEFGWISGSPDTKTPGKDTLWQTNATQIVPDVPIELFWDNGQGQHFIRTITLDKNYMFHIQQRVENTSGASVTLYPYGLINRQYDDTGEHFFILHEGPIGVMNETLSELSYEELRDEKKVSAQTTKGWLGITDKYWLTALIPDQKRGFSGNFNHYLQGQKDRYQTDYLAQGIEIKSGDSMSYSTHFFAGAKQVKLLDSYAQQLDIPLFDRAVDFGVLYFLTRPIFELLSIFNGWLGNFGLAILALTVCIKLVLFPLANKSYKAMSQLKLLMPKIKELQERHANDKMKLNQEMMTLYKKEQVNPMSGCLPILIQMPIFFALYKVLFVTIEMRHADFYGWIDDLSAKDPTSMFNLFGLLPYGVPDVLTIGAWPVIMAATMVVQMKLNPKPTDPVQAKVMSLLPYIFLFAFATFPAGLVVYWAWNNFLSIIQQYIIMRKAGVKIGG